MAVRTVRLFSGAERGLDQFGLLLVLVVASVTLNSLLDVDDPTSSLRSEIGWIAVTAITGVTLMVAMRASGVARGPRLVANAIVMVAIGVTVVTVIVSLSGAEVVDISGRPSVTWLLLAVFSPLVVVRRLVEHRTVTKETLYGAVAAFLLIALAFDYSFLVVQTITGDPFFTSGDEPTTSYMYFSLVTIATLGYGDLVPAGPFGRYLATAEAVIGTVFLVTFVARLVALFGMEKRPVDETAPEPPPPRRT
jgi:hypothetical protein